MGVDMVNLGIQYLVKLCKALQPNENRGLCLGLLIAIVVIAAATLVGTTMAATFNTVASAMAGVAGGGS
jgi:hypothetical protein